MNKSVRQKTWRLKRTAIKTSVHAQGSGTVLDCECVRARVSVKSQQEAAAGSIPGKENRPENDKQLKNNSFSGDNPQSDASLFHNLCSFIPIPSPVSLLGFIRLLLVLSFPSLSSHGRCLPLSFSFPPSFGCSLAPTRDKVAPNKVSRFRKLLSK